MDFAAVMNLLPGSPSSVSVMSPTAFTPPMSPSANAMPHSSVAWAQQNVPALHLSGGSNLQSSRLRSSLNARDIPTEDYNLLPDLDLQQQQLLNELSCISQPSLNNNSLNRSGRLKALTPSNLDDRFSAESLSPRYTDQAPASAVFSPTHKSAVINQFQQQQSLLSPINTSFCPKNVDHPLLQASFASGRMSPRNVEPISPMSPRMSMLAQREKQHQQLRSLSSRELGSNSAAMVGSPFNSWSKWGSSNGKLDWTVSAEELGKLRRSNSFELGNGEEPDLSWVQSLVKESPTEIKEKLATNVSSAASASSSESLNLTSQTEPVDHAVAAWVEHWHIDQLVAQQNGN
uniref:Nucleic acid binding protein n=1 Tax=Rhizophora mucronata TaxID=61149 RepID=A0A2P2MJZ4_RHIMU